MNTPSRFFSSYRKILRNQEEGLKMLWKGTVVGFATVLLGVMVFAWYQYTWVTSDAVSLSPSKMIRTGITMAELDAIKAEHENLKAMFEQVTHFEEKAPVLK